MRRKQKTISRWGNCGQVHPPLMNFSTYRLASDSMWYIHDARYFPEEDVIRKQIPKLRSWWLLLSTRLKSSTRLDTISITQNGNGFTWKSKCVYVCTTHTQHSMWMLYNTKLLNGILINALSQWNRYIIPLCLLPRIWINNKVRRFVGNK